MVDGGPAGDAHILLVEDDAAIARLIARRFGRLGYVVSVARSSAEARAATSRVFACGIFDIDLGDGDGVDLATDLFASGVVRTVVFFTGSTDPDVRRRADRIGRIIDKLSSTSVLENHVLDLLSRARGSPGGGPASGKD